ncbi:hypothetical protein N9R64_01800 [Emcibacteraceae bacterium]|nr:hypothetical protein [Emcibacteraceae bacterium]
MAAGTPTKAKEALKPAAKEEPSRPEVKKSRMDDNRRRGGKLTVTQALSGNLERKKDVKAVSLSRRKKFIVRLLCLIVLRLRNLLTV